MIPSVEKSRYGSWIRWSILVGVVENSYGCGGDSGSGNRADAAAPKDAVAKPDASELDAGLDLRPGIPVLLVGTASDGTAVNPPEDWPLAAGKWNAKAAHYSPAGDRIAFETHRDDIIGGSIIAPDEILAAGVDRYYVAGPETGTANAVPTSVLYVADADGSSPVCIGCQDVVDGMDGAEVYRVAPSATEMANPRQRQAGAVIYANQNKDLAAWTEDGHWLIAGVEMPRHALTHGAGTSETGQFNDLWAISIDGKIWVQLTDYASTWELADEVAPMPFACLDAPNCPAGCQYVGRAEHPFSAYSCSGTGDPPPASGTMRPRVSHTGDIVVWSERVGLHPSYTWGGPLQLAVARIDWTGGLPGLSGYRRNLTPTPDAPDGVGLWSNPDGSTRVGAGYEPWGFSQDDRSVTIATDVFLSTSSEAVQPEIRPTSQAFVDVGLWAFADSDPTLENATDYSPRYSYQDNAAPYPLRKYGHWEEPAVFSIGAAYPFLAFGSSANLDPPWTPTMHGTTFGLEVWVKPLSGSGAATKVTAFNSVGDRSVRVIAYPTEYNGRGQFLYLTVVPANAPGANPPGSIWALKLP